MKRITVFLVISCVVMSLTIVAVLFVLSEDLTHHVNSFSRIFPPHSILKENTIDVEGKSYYIAGLTNHRIYLGSFKTPLRLLAVNMDSGTNKDLRLKIKDGNVYQYKITRVKIDSPLFYITDGSIPAIFKGSLLDGEAYRYTYDSVYFSKILPVGAKSFIIRSESKASREFVLGKIQADSPHVVIKNGLLEKQVDGRFCVDGMMNYDADNKRFVYSYYYRNGFIVMDTNLNLIYKGHTIDTVSRAKIRVVKGSSMSAPPLRVNKLSCVSGGLFFVNSNLMGKNEQKEVFDAHSVIDIYGVEKGDYKFSIYAGDAKNGSLQDFKVFDDKLVALFESGVKIYTLRTSYLK